jgi:hypothetical protein
MKEEYILNDNIKCYEELEKAINHYILRINVFLPKEVVESTLINIIKKRVRDFYISK